MSAADAEALVARLLELVPAGHELVERPDGIEIAVYVPPSELARVQQELPPLETAPVEPGWRDAWRRFHRPAVVGSLWIGPPWEQPPEELQAVVIDPGRAFGTGAHPTTRLCLDLVQSLPRGSLIDAGCGSGVLAIAAVRLGFDPVLALDVDPDAVEVARRNAEANGVRIDARVADATTSPPPADVVVANIELAAVEQIAARARAGLLVTSGYLAEDIPVLRGRRRLERRLLDGWAADLSAPQ